MNVVTLERLKQFKTLLMASISNPSGDSNPNLDWLQIVYPVGSIYMSTSNVHPSELFGFGTWEQIKDTFLLCAGDNYAAGTVGGEAEHILTEEELAPHHHHHEPNVLTAAESNNGFTVGQATNKEYVRIASVTDSEDSGGGAAHNNMPPYLAVYVWKRVG